MRKAAVNILVCPFPVLAHAHAHTMHQAEFLEVELLSSGRELANLLMGAGVWVGKNANCF